MKTGKEILQQIDSDIEKQFITAKFGGFWKKHAKEHYNIDEIIDIAWKQGRKNILLERKFNLLNRVRIIQSNYISFLERCMPLTAYNCKKRDEWNKRIKEESESIE